MIRVESIQQLEAYVNFLIERELCVMPIENYGITFFLDSPLKKTQAQLKSKRDNRNWDGCSYRDEGRNLLILLSSAGTMTNCIATVLSLHSNYLEQFDSL
ncbi:hypothetical protein [Escherichia coli]|uniref:hypothetical protein n=1 Tax=Escherichia coli TaxID=562 RepID=UPI00191846D9|nr:hypothetical protein [Escherichia coli]